MVVRASLVLGPLLSLLACAPQDLASGEDSRSIIGGAANLADPAVALIRITPKSAASQLCTGTLISPRVVLTAAHCVDFGSGGAEFSVYFGTTTVAEDLAFIETIDVTDSVFHQQFDANRLTNGYDIALLLLESDASSTPLPYNRKAVSALDFDKPLRLVGWGNSDGGNGTASNPGSGAGVKRQSTSQLSSLSPGGLLLEYGDASANTCQGDSGGPTFLTVDGKEVVAGVTSYGVLGCEGGSASTNVSLYTTFISNWVALKDPVIPPDLRITRPRPNATVLNRFAVEIDATDNTRVDRVELWVDGELHSTASLAPYIFDTPDKGDGEVKVEARAYDNRGAETITQISVTVDSSCTSCGNNGAMGDDCQGNENCSSGLCGLEGSTGVCTTTCDPDGDPCGSGFECIESGGMNVCWPKGGGCSASGGFSSPTLSAFLLLLTLGFSRRRPAQLQGKPRE